ncbi:MAG: hypothetical protein JSW60_04585 [Thermoplasmatales archaeon]|nr:MAG: hypothetical protein JSW60_04585 [Thermoplasmatales archaeon]
MDRTKRRKKRPKKKIKYVKSKKEKEFKEKYEGKYYFNSMKIKSKSELLICYFLSANRINVAYEREIYIDGKEYRPDFIIEDDKGNIVILEHFGIDDEQYNKKKIEKIRNYKKLCDENKNFYFIQTDEDDIKNLKDNLGKKLNDETPIKKSYWR